MAPGDIRFILGLALEGVCSMAARTGVLFG
jgi:hypothetical protein